MAAVYSRVDVDQFYGIEIGEFPARIAEVALWMMDHIMNNALSTEFGNPYLRIPLKKSPHIHPVYNGAKRSGRPFSRRSSVPTY